MVWVVEPVDGAFTYCIDVILGECFEPDSHGFARSGCDFEEGSCDADCHCHPGSTHHFVQG